MNKDEIIRAIKKVVIEWGGFSINEVEHEEAPVKSIISSTSQLVEHIGIDSVKVTTYVHETEIDSEEIEYENLGEDLLEELLRIAENYDTDMDKTMKRILN